MRLLAFSFTDYRRPFYFILMCNDGCKLVSREDVFLSGQHEVSVSEQRHTARTKKSPTVQQPSDRTYTVGLSGV